MSTIVEARGLKMYFPVGRTLGGKPKKLLKAVDDVSFSIAKGETFGLGRRKRLRQDDGWPLSRAPV